ncbi:hypothetical protein D3P04_03735 [Paracoccus onubensis]|uniref:Uncharacterized protein n=1 Tax=Paracoccus onubensis TaxID=1675788 RepID=A0A418T4G3_9RHOB|nr:hypothetical protein D3P04_03735 [Paracoccus onubensis]
MVDSLGEFMKQQNRVKLLVIGYSIFFVLMMSFVAPMFGWARWLIGGIGLLPYLALLRQNDHN